ncbi:MAG: glycosyltransferase family 1 protein [Patescibacteria group bacterium]|jgi:glycosyltransferase involved in cell wall biosynthesis
MGKIRLGIDARLYGVQKRGIGRYTESLLQALDGARDRYTLVAFIEQDNTLRQSLAERGWEVHEVRARVYGLREQLSFVQELMKASLDLLHVPHFNVPYLYRRPYVVTVHDLILHHYPNRMSSTRSLPVYTFKYLAYRIGFRHTINAARQIITVSGYTKEDLLTYYPWLAPKTSSIIQPVQLTVETVTDKVTNLHYNSNEPYVLVVGAFYPHKNIEELLDAWVAVGEHHKVTLVLVGPEDSFAKRLQDRLRKMESSVSRHVVFMGAVGDEELRELYRKALFVLFPSLYEGFGLPGVEASLLGKSIVSSARSVLPESYGRSAVYVPAGNTVYLARALNALLADARSTTERPPISTTSIEQFRDQLLVVYDRALQNK